MRVRPSSLQVMVSGASLALLLALAAPALAEFETVAQEGAVAVGEGRGVAGLRRAALSDAVRRAVDGVAGRLAEGDGAPRPTRAELDEWLGEDRRDYTSGFRLVRDLGARRPEILTGLGEGDEYAVAAEVTVDTERVRRRLVQAGAVLPRTAARKPSGRILLVLEPLDSHAAYAYVRETLGAVPVEFTRGRAVLGLATDLHPESVVERLRRRAPEDIQVGAADWDGSTLRLVVRHVPSAHASQDAARLTR